MSLSLTRRSVVIVLQCLLAWAVNSPSATSSPQADEKSQQEFPNPERLLPSQQTAEERERAIVIQGKWVWTGTGGPPIEGGRVLVEKGRIAAVGTKKEVQIPSDAQFVDRSNLFIMPGLVDSHEHFAMDQFAGVSQAKLMERSAGHLALRAARNGRTALRSGVTTARVATEVVKYGKDYVALDYAKAFNEELLPGPRIVAGGHLLHAPGAYPSNYPAMEGTGATVSGVEEIRQTIREDVLAGADFCKMSIAGDLVPGPGQQSVRQAVFFTDEEIKALIEECHRLGKKVTAHTLAGGPSVQAAIAAGIDSFEHPVLFSEEEWKQLSEHGIFAVLAESPLFVPGAEVMGWGGQIETPPNAEEMLRTMYTRAIASGAKLAVGGGGYQQPGALAHEVAVLVYFGMSNEKALLVATRNGGELTGLPVGTLEVGNYADLIGIRGNPLEDISVLHNVIFVMKGGKIYDLSEK